MKHVLLMLLFLFCLDNAAAQKKYSKAKIRKHLARVRESKLKGKVIVSLDTLFNSGTAYAIFKKKKQLPYHSYSVNSINNIQLIQIETASGNDRDKTLYFAFKFIESGKTAELDKFYVRDLPRKIVENNLIDSNRIDPLNEMKFIIKYPQIFSNPSTKIENNSKPDMDEVRAAGIYQIIIRERETIFYTSEGKILQDYKLIGSYKKRDATIGFYLPNGIKVAEANESDASDNTWLLMSLKDRRTKRISSTQNDVLKDLIDYLIKNSYL
jgi:virulence-associated protein VapD